MSDPPYDDTEAEAAWILSMRRQVEDYLRREGLVHEGIGADPAWHVPDVTSIWAIESRKSPGWVGWWAISGDHPTDHISSANTKHPRAALRAFCARWRELVRCMRHGVPHPAIRLGDPGDTEELADLFEPRVELLESWSADDGLWDYDEAEFEDH